MPNDNRGQHYNVTSHGTNSEGNHYCSRQYDNQASDANAFHYSNRDNSYYYSNSDGSTFHQGSNGTSTYTTPSGDSYTRSQGDAQYSSSGK
ncbi:hypothetical protein CROQUDRAFT_653867 [Cronartium quercuum f. sp. fusiforme G11]|uniref:Uncharacterized protein n=1 Tax=Cronartium quercuum f. sp. fusiforme G11 TaxID=708437 RepID=A0A9P6TF22_9BASI|nr:hypothetical protein CROQUDRAFT_653867 [Cronartium quercuum f. sp. fusiforme G11]